MHSLIHRTLSDHLPAWPAGPSIHAIPQSLQPSFSPRPYPSSRPNTRNPVSCKLLAPDQLELSSTKPLEAFVSRIPTKSTLPPAKSKIQLFDSILASRPPLHEIPPTGSHFHSPIISASLGSDALIQPLTSTLTRPSLFPARTIHKSASLHRHF